MSYNEKYETNTGAVNSRCYVYPQFLKRDRRYVPVNASDFPKYGRVEVRIQGGDTTEDIFARFGPLGIVQGTDRNKTRKNVCCCRFIHNSRLGHHQKRPSGLRSI